MEQEKRDSVKSLGKALHLIDIINQARTPMTLMSLSQVSGFPKSTVYALLNTLRSYDCIRQGSDGRYYLGTRLFEWGCGVSASWELNNVARPYLEKLAAHTDATALLSRIEGNSVVVIDQSTAMCSGIYVTTEIGTHLPLHATSQGKLLAAMSDASAKAFLSGAGQLESFTPHTIVEQESILPGAGANSRQRLRRGKRRIQDRPAVGLRAGLRPLRRHELRAQRGGTVPQGALSGI